MVPNMYSYSNNFPMNRSEGAEQKRICHLMNFMTYPQMIEPAPAIKLEQCSIFHAASIHEEAAQVELMVASGR